MKAKSTVRVSVMPLRALLLLAIAAKLLVGVSAQVTTNATCLSSFSVLSNSKGQSPCLVAAYLQSACNSGNWRVRDLPVDTHYTGPDQTEINSCQCSTVTYSMISACGICQGRTAEAWSAWRSNCSKIYPSMFTETIPVNTAVPAWAYLDVIASDGLNVTAAEADTNAPESTGVVPATVATSTPSGTPVSGSSPKKSSHAGAIAGGVVGGLAGVALIAGIVVFLIRRRRAHVPPSAAYKGYGINTPIHSPPPMSQDHTHPIYVASAQSKYYDPADPSTFPSTTPPAMIYSTESRSVPHSHPGQPGQYNFVPEV